MTDHTAPERIMISACGKAIVTGQTAFPDDAEYIRADLHRAEVDALVAAAYEAAANVADDEGNWHGRAIADRIRSITPADARAALDRKIARAVQTALEMAVSKAEKRTAPIINKAYSATEIARAIADDARAIRVEDVLARVEGEP